MLAMDWLLIVSMREKLDFLINYVIKKQTHENVNKDYLRYHQCETLSLVRPVYYWRKTQNKSQFCETVKIASSLMHRHRQILRRIMR